MACFLLQSMLPSVVISQCCKVKEMTFYDGQWDIHWSQQWLETALKYVMENSIEAAIKTGLWKNPKCWLDAWLNRWQQVFCFRHLCFLPLDVWLLSSEVPDGVSPLLFPGPRHCHTPRRFERTTLCPTVCLKHMVCSGRAGLQSNWNLIPRWQTVRPVIQGIARPLHLQIEGATELKCPLDS